MDDATKKAEDIKKLHQTLLLCQGDLRSVTTICDKLLALTPGDPAVVMYKAVALIDASHFDTATKLLVASGTWPFGVAYCLYRQERYEEALGALTGGTYEERNLRAQCLYRSEKFPAAAKEFQELVKSARAEGRAAEEVDEIVVNYTAALMEASRPQDAYAFTREYRNERGSSDLTLNGALSAVQVGHVKDGIKMVVAATNTAELLRVVVTTGTLPQLSGEESGLCALLGTAYAQCGEEGVAMEYLGAVIKRKTTSATTTAVCLNNWVALQGMSDVFDSLHKMKHVLSKQVELKLSANQRMITKYNNAMLSLSMGKPQQALTQATALAKDFPSSELALVALACALAHSGNRGKAIEVLAGHKDPTPRVVLVLAQLTMEHTNDMDAVLAVLTTKLGPETLYQSNVVAAFTHNALARSRQDIAISFLQKATSLKTPNVDLLRLLIRVQTERKMYREAVATYKTLLQHVQDDATLAGYVAALSNVDVEEALAMCERLPKYYNVKGIVAADRAALEAEEPPRPRVDKRAAEETQDEKEKPKKRRTKSKKSRGGAVVPEGAPPPDPERWMPIRDRPSLKKIGKKAMAKMALERRDAAKASREAHRRRALGLPPLLPEAEEEAPETDD